MRYHKRSDVSFWELFGRFDTFFVPVLTIFSIISISLFLSQVTYESVKKLFFATFTQETKVGWVPEARDIALEPGTFYVYNGEILLGSDFSTDQCRIELFSGNSSKVQVWVDCQCIQFNPLFFKVTTLFTLILLGLSSVFWIFYNDLNLLRRTELVRRVGSVLILFFTSWYFTWVMLPAMFASFIVIWLSSAMIFLILCVLPYAYYFLE
jgi:hypothetical protein